MKVGECKSLTCVGGTLTVVRIIEDEYEIVFGKHSTTYDLYDYQNIKIGFRNRSNFRSAFYMITSPNDNLEIMFMEMVWLHCGVQLGYHQVVNLFEE